MSGLQEHLAHQLSEMRRLLDQAAYIRDAKRHDEIMDRLRQTIGEVRRVRALIASGTPGD